MRQKCVTFDMTVAKMRRPVHLDSQRRTRKSAASTPVNGDPTSETLITGAYNHLKMMNFWSVDAMLSRMEKGCRIPGSGGARRLCGVGHAVANMRHSGVLIAPHAVPARVEDGDARGVRARPSSGGRLCLPREAAGRMVEARQVLVPSDGVQRCQTLRLIALATGAMTKSVRRPTSAWSRPRTPSSRDLCRRKRGSGRMGHDPGRPV